MKHAEKVILTNLCMIQDGTKVLVEEKVGKGADGIIFPAVMWKSMNRLLMLSSAK